MKPDLLMFDGQGIAHPRGIGIASHIGLWLERPSISVAKSRLYGQHAEPGTGLGDWATLFDERDSGQAICAVLRTRQKVNRLYISAGYLIDVERSVTFVMDCVMQFRLPAPIR